MLFRSLSVAAATESGSAKKDGAVANERLPYDAQAADWESDIHPYGPGPVCTGTGEHAYERDAVAYADKFIRSLPG